MFKVIYDAGDSEFEDKVQRVIREYNSGELTRDQAFDALYDMGLDPDEVLSGPSEGGYYFN